MNATTMFNPPLTIESAKVKRYNVWGGNRAGTAYDPCKCAYEAYTHDRMAMFYQCTRKPGKGPNGLYCTQHAKIVANR